MKLSRLDLHDMPNVRGEGLEYLAELKQLRQLRLKGTQLTDEALEHLKALTWLEKLDLTDTGATEAGVAGLQTALPRCRIESLVDPAEVEAPKREEVAAPADGLPGLFELRAQAEQGDPEAQFNLGVCFHDGQGVKQDIAEAVKWYRKAAEQGLGSASFYLGFCYAKGEGVKKDDAEAVKWYLKAAEQG